MKQLNSVFFLLITNFSQVLASDEYPASSQDIQALIHNTILDYNTILSKLNTLENSGELQSLSANVSDLSSLVASLQSRIEILSDMFNNLKIDTDHQLATHSYVATTGEFIHQLMDEITSIENIIQTRQVMRPLEQKLDHEAKLNLDNYQETLGSHRHFHQVLSEMNHAMQDNRTYWLSLVSCILLMITFLVVYISSSMTIHPHTD
jgi:hypothetical protein